MDDWLCDNEGMMIQTAIMATLTTLSFQGCLPDGDPVDPVRPAQTIYLPQSFETWPGTPRFHADHGDFLIVIMDPAPIEVQLAWCNDTGGELIFNPFTDISTCEGIDF